MAVALMQSPQREQCVEPFRPRLADADQDPAGERNLVTAGSLDVSETHGWIFVGRSEMRPAPLRQALRRGLQHDSLAKH